MKVKIVLVIFVLSFLLTACAPGVQPLLDDYNALFDVTLRDELLIANKNDWLPNFLDVKIIGHTLDLVAPAGGENYKWSLEPDPAFSAELYPLPMGFVLEDCVQESGRRFVVNVGEVGFEAGSRYILSCTFEMDSQTISDRCKLAFVK